MAEDILDQLAQNPDLNVASRTASFQLADNAELAVTAQELNVSYLLEGSVRRMRDNLRITAQLIRASDGFHVWSKSHERSFADGFKMQVGVAHNIAHLVQVELEFDVRRPERTAHTRNGNQTPVTKISLSTQSKKGWMVNIFAGSRT